MNEKKREILFPYTTSINLSNYPCSFEKLEEILESDNLKFLIQSKSLFVRHLDSKTPFLYEFAPNTALSNIVAYIKEISYNKESNFLNITIEFFYTDIGRMAYRLAMDNKISFEIMGLMKDSIFEKLLYFNIKVEE